MEFPSGFGITGTVSETSDSLGLITAPEGMKAAAVFTENRVKAHPVLYSMQRLPLPSHNAVIVNRGSANAATGFEGRKKLEELVAAVSERTDLPPQGILAASTGVIGKQISWSREDMDGLCARAGQVQPADFARAIMTTDTREKTAWATCDLNGKKVTVFGAAKGSGMISPKLATMLSFIMTDAEISKDMLQESLREAANKTFNNVIVDGDTSTNDTVFLLSSGKASNRQIRKKSSTYATFFKTLLRVCVSLSEMLASDGEGATKMIKLSVKGTSSDEEASRAARAVAVSPLCKTAFYGASPNWGRIISAVGAVGVEVKLEEFSLYANGVSWVDCGRPDMNSAGRLKEILQGSRYELDIVLGRGTGKALAYTCDMSPEYVRINAHYLS